jgi:hypothetical protein
MNNNNQNYNNVQTLPSIKQKNISNDISQDDPRKGRRYKNNKSNDIFVI